jgi:protein O-mannosyl-transferase
MEQNRRQISNSPARTGGAAWRGPTGPSPSGRVHGLVFLLLLSIALAAYGNTLAVPFFFDDSQNIVDNPDIRLNALTRSGLEAAGLKGNLRSRPVANLSFALNYYFHGYHLVGYHLVNILIHGLAGFFLYLVSLATLGAFGLSGRGPAMDGPVENGAGFPAAPPPDVLTVSLLAAVIWMVHPVQTQAVTYIVQRMTSLCTLFYLLSVFSYIRWRRVEPGRQKWFWAAGCIACGILALGSKEIAVTLPFFIFLYEWYFFQDLQWAWFKRHVWFLLAISLLFVGLVCALLGRTPAEIVAASYRYRDFTLIQRVLTQFGVVVFYVSLLLYPHPSRLNLDHDFPLSVSLTQPPGTLAAMGVVFGLMGLAVLLARKERLFSFCILWFLGNLALESSVIGLEIIFEHRLYLPSCLFVLGMVLAVNRAIRPRGVKIFLLAAVAAGFGMWTYERNRAWCSQVSLWADCVAKSPEKVRPHINFGAALARAGAHERAEQAYRRALALDPANPVVLNNLGQELVRKGRIDEAIRFFKQAIRLKKGFVGLHHYNLANALRAKGAVEAAIDQYHLALRVNPKLLLARNNLGIAYVLMKRYDDAIFHFEKAVSIAPDFRDARNNLERAMADREKSRALGHETGPGNGASGNTAPLPGAVRNGPPSP